MKLVFFTSRLVFKVFFTSRLVFKVFFTSRLVFKVVSPFGLKVPEGFHVEFGFKVVSPFGLKAPEGFHVIPHSFPPIPPIRAYFEKYFFMS